MSDFDQDLGTASDPATAAWLDAVYRDFFGETISITRTTSGKTRAQANGVDVMVFLEERDKHVRIDEKVRSREFGDDILLELYSNEQRKTPGWLVKPLSADFIANAYPTTGRCEVLPVLPLRRAWRVHGRKWYRLAQDRQDGFGLHRGTTTSGGRVLYETLNISVPRLVLLAAIGLASKCGTSTSASLPAEPTRSWRPGPWLEADWAEIREWSKQLDREFDAVGGRQ